MDTKQWKTKAVLSFSAMAFLVLGISRSKLDMIFTAVLALMVYTAICLKGYYVKSQEVHVPSLCFSVVILAYTGGNFYFNWIGSTVGRQFLSRFGLNYTVVLAGSSFIGMVFAFPFVYAALQWFCRDMGERYFEKLYGILHSRKFFLFCTTFAIIGIVLQVVFAFSLDIWVDEAFSLAMIRHSYGEMIKLTMQDVHPPLYYIILKFFVDMAHMLFGEFPSVYAAKFVSAVPYILLFLLCFLKIRKEWNDFGAGMWAVCLVGMQSLFWYGVEVRMYSFGMLFVTLVYFYADAIVRKRKKKDWALFVLFSAAAAYTHYFACVAAAVSWAFLFVWFFIHDKKRLMALGLAAFCTALCYLPWLFTLIQQVEKVSKNYWISDVTLWTLYDHVNFIFGKQFFVFPVCALLLFLGRGLKKYKKNQWHVAFSLMGISMPFLVTAVGVVVSLLVRPIFVSRYILPALACFWFGCLVACEVCKRKKLIVCFCCMLVMTASYNYVRFIRSEHNGQIQSERLTQLLQTDHNAVFLSSALRMSNILREMSETEISMWGGGETSSVMKQVYGKQQSYYSVEELFTLFEEGRTVYLVDCPALEGNSIEEILNDSRLKVTDLGTYYAEYNFLVYQVEQK